MDFSLIVQVSTLAGSALAVIITLRVTVKFIKAEFAEFKETTRKDINGIQTEIRQIGEILVRLADIRGEIRVLETRLDAHDVSIHDIQARCEREYHAR